jgi:rubredoxin
MQAGRELDAKVAEKVFGQTDFNHLPAVWREDENTDGFVCPRCGIDESSFDDYPCIDSYSRNISAAGR